MIASEPKSPMEQYQCTGCTNGNSPFSCTQYSQNYIGIGCTNHHPGTIINNIWKIFLGLPRGFNRIGDQKYFPIYIFASIQKQKQQYAFDRFNVPIWKYQDENNVIIRGYQPRLNQGFIFIILNSNCKKIEGLEITNSDIAEMG